MVELQHDMASQVSLDVSGAVKSFKTLTSAVKANSAEWKANSAEAKRAGDYQKAQSEQIKGLSREIELQKARLADLQKQQAEVDTSTEKGTKKYYDLQKSITQTTSAINKSTSQLDKAKSGMSYYTSGLADLQKGYKQATQLSQSYVDRLKAEGKTQEANAKQMSLYKDSVDHLNKQLEIQQQELSRVASESGKSSDAYRQQEIRVNKTATSLANAKTQMSDLSKEIQQSQPTGFFDRLKQKLTGVDKDAKETKTSISDIVKGSFIGTSLSNAFSGLTSGLGSAVKQGFELAKAGKETAENWSHIGVSANGVKQLTGQVAELRGVSDASGASVTQLQRSLYGLTNGNIAQTKALTNELYAFGKAGGASEEQISQMGTKLTRVFSSSKVNLATFNRTFASMPGLKKGIQEASGMTQDAFTKALQSGKITGAQMKQYMLEASKGSSKAWSDFGDTTEGKLAKAKGTFKNFESAVMSPIVTAGLKGISKGLDGIVSKNGKLNNTGKSIQGLAKNLSANVSKGIITTLSFIANHSKGIAVTASAVLGLSVAIKACSIAQGLFNASMSASQIGLIVAGVTALGAAIAAVVVHWKDITKWFSKTFKSIQKGMSSFGKSVKRTWNNLWNSIFKFFRNIWNSIAKFAKKSWNGLTKNLSSFGKSIKKIWDSIWNAVNKFFSDIWKDITKTWSSWTKSISSGLSSFGKGFKSTWNSLWNGVSSIFSNAWKTVKKLAQNGMNGLIDIINKGIGAVNSVIHAFGGSSHTISVLGHVKFANGTQSIFKNLSSPITKPIIATLNDGNDSPATNNKEMLIHSDGSAGIVQGRNTEAILMPGDNIINAHETAMLMSMMGNYHFAGGTWSWLSSVGTNVKNGAKSAWNWAKGAFSGIGSWIGKTTNNLKKFFDLATKIVSHPIKYVEGLFSWNNPKGVIGAMSDLTKGAFGKVEDSVKKWWSTLWSMASGDLSGGASSALLKAVEKYGEGKPYVWGASGPSTFDCSGLVMYALNKAFGIQYPHFSGSQYSETQHISKSQAHSGDLVFWGNGGSEHVGVYAGGNKYYSAQSPSQGIHMNTLDSVVGYGAPLFGRVKGLKQGSTDDTKATNSLQKLIKSQVGGFFKFISKLGGLFGVSNNEGAGSPTGSHKNWLAEAKIPSSWWSKLNQMITAESGWNPNAVNPDSGTYGLGQMQSYNVHYYTAHGSKSNPIAQLMGIRDYINDRYGGISQAYAFRQAHNWYSNGGISWTEKLAHISENNKPEMIIPLDASKHNRANELLDQTTKIVNGGNNSIQQEKTDASLTTIITLLGTIADDSKLDKITQLVEMLTNNPISVDTKVDLDGKVLAKSLEKYQVRRAQGGKAGYAF